MSEPAWVPFGGAVPGAVALATTLPGSPFDGQEAILVDSLTNPSYQWRFRYNAGSSSAYKWECVGSTPLIVKAGGDGGRTLAAQTWTDFIAGPTFTIPRAGDYEVVWAVTVMNWAVPAVGYTISARINIGGVTSTQTYGVNPANTQQFGATVSRPERMNGLAASAAGKMEILADIAVASGWVDPVVSVRPIRVS